MVEEFKVLFSCGILCWQLPFLFSKLCQRRVLLTLVPRKYPLSTLRLSLVWKASSLDICRQVDFQRGCNVVYLLTA